MKKIFMNKLIISAKLLFAIGLVLTTLNCGFAPKSECELTEADGKNILGINVAGDRQKQSRAGQSRKS